MGTIFKNGINYSNASAIENLIIPKTILGPLTSSDLQMSVNLPVGDDNIFKGGDTLYFRVEEVISTHAAAGPTFNVRFYDATHSIIMIENFSAGISGKKEIYSVPIPIRTQYAQLSLMSGSIVTIELIKQEPYEDEISTIDNSINYSSEERLIGTWIDNSSIYRRVYTVTEGLAKDNLIKVADLPTGFKEMIKGFCIVQTTEGSYSNNDILTYTSTTGIFIKQNFTSYPSKIYVIIEYTK